MLRACSARLDATQDDDAADSGAIYVYTNNAGDWELEAYIKASNSVADYLFGTGYRGCLVTAIRWRSAPFSTPPTSLGAPE